MPTWATNNRAILVARTLHQGYQVPGYAIDGVGYFVSKERQPFKTDNFQVLVDTQIKLVGYKENHEKCLVAVDSSDETKRIKIGSFTIDRVRFCGMVDDQNTCYINFYGQLRFKIAPEFQVLVELATFTEESDSEDPDSDSETKSLVKKINDGCGSLKLKGAPPYPQSSLLKWG
ncbi:Hypothetical predicted protein [Cloeon dipterum]|uniref:Uncharacterized protein n=1 Tax=Cloeon dipterum TaxID=197152 RepID=A0A8S1E292_9INSE|nr:Hypothetical predicted protein [Cloeon dipterum]